MRDDSHKEIVAYQKDWQHKFMNEKENIASVLPDTVLDIQHIGSTAIPGMSGKPIVDIGVLIPSWKDADTYVEALRAIGYTFDAAMHAQQENPERHFLTKGDPKEFHLSIAYDDKASFWERQILFRDYLREHPEAVAAYNQLKEELLKEDPTGTGSYIPGKTDFVMSILKKAGFENEHFDLSKY